MGKTQQAYTPIRKSSDEEDYSNNSTESLSSITHVNYLRKYSNKILTKILLFLILLTISLLAVNIHFFINRSRAVNLQDGLYTQLVPSSIHPQPDQ